jgi:hypothetical protein
VSLALTLAALALGQAPSPPPFRAAVVVGVNEAFDDSQADLRYADDDAARYAELLAGQVEHLELLTVLDAESQELFPEAARQARLPDAAGLDAALTRLRALADGARALGRRAELYFVYVGHGRVRGGEGEVRLLGGALSRTHLTEAVLADRHFDRKHLMVDACSAYLLVNARGESDAEVDAAFERFLEGQTLDRFPDVGAVLATSGAGPTHEWSRYQGGVFSHELRSALTGAADADDDGKVGYGEVEAFLAAANLEVPALKGRPKVFVRAPRIERAAALVELDAQLPALELPAELAGHYVLEDARGLRYAELHKEAGFVMALRLQPERAYALLSGDGAELLRIPEPAGRTRLRLPLEPVPARGWDRGGEALPGQVRDAPPGAFASPYGPRFRGRLLGAVAGRAERGASGLDGHAGARLRDPHPGLHRGGGGGGGPGPLALAGRGGLRSLRRLLRHVGSGRAGPAPGRGGDRAPAGRRPGGHRGGGARHRPRAPALRLARGLTSRPIANRVGPPVGPSMNRKLTCLTLGAAALLVGPRPAAACGGFFCSQTPVLQTAERVVFEIEGDVITAYVQLQYSGTDPNFAWVVPVPEVPQVEVGVGAAMFDALDAQTRPIFVSPAGVPAADASLDVSSCGGALFGGGGRAAPPSLQVRSVPLPEVDVWAKATVGPFEYVVLSAERAADLNDWLGINGYQLQPGSDPVVQGYLDRGMKLLGLKLAPDAGASQVEPIKLTYRDSAGCATIPLQLTAIAAVPNLEIITWVFGAHRVAPENFAHVTVDAAALGGERDYLPALGRAVDALGGRGFVTEKAGATADLSDSGDPRLAELLARHAYVTRLRTVIDPSEMTEDPAFTLAPELPDVSNEIVLGGGVTVTSGMMFGILLLGLAGRRRSPPRAARARFPWNAPSGFASHRSRMARYAPSSSDRSTKSRSADRMGYFSDGLPGLRRARR